MLHKAQIQNFQAHTNSNIEFGPGVNVIRGSSDNGKSSIIRAIYWALFNRPSGTGFFTWGATTPTATRLYFDNGAIVLREKDKKTNFYMRRTSEADTNQDKFQALRTDVPTEVSEVHQMEPFNLQRQHDRYFLLQDSPGEVGRQLNEVTNLSIIGETLAAANRYVGNKKTIVGQLVAEKQSLENQFYSLPPIEELLPIIEKCREQAALLSELRKTATQVGAISAAYEKAKALLVTIPDVSDLLPLIAEINENLTARATLQRQCAAVSSLAARYEKSQQTLAGLPHLEGLDKTLINARDMLRQREEIRNRGQQIWEAHYHWLQKSAEVAGLQETLDAAVQAVAAFKENNPLCPVCNQKWEAV